jgi:molybdopterin-containing oxidoreductase family iron-sulfur binding subunit
MWEARTAPNAIIKKKNNYPNMKTYWRSVEEYKQSIKAAKDGKVAKQEPQPEFSVEGLSEEEKTGNTTRRDFLKMLGFTVSYAALASSCEMPVRKAIPYLNQPEEIRPGIANYYATSYFDGHDYCSLLVKTREGRPIKIDGNELSSITRGGTTARVQASVLSLYDTERLQNPMKDQNPAAWTDIDGEISSKLQEISGNGGKIVLMSSTIISPTTKKAVNEFLEAYPGSEWVMYDAIPQDAMLAANNDHFGVKAIPAYHFDKADLIVGFNADFHGNWILPVQYTKQYVKGRSLLNGREKLSKHIQYESYMSLTGSNADARVSIKPSEELTVLLNLYNEIAEAKGNKTYPVPSSPVDVVTLGAELLENRGNSLVVSGTNDYFIQAVVNGINHMLENYGKTIDLNDPVYLKQGDDKKVKAIVQEMNEGKVQGLILYGVNPVYDYAEPELFYEGMKKAELTVSFDETLTETSRMCQYICPDNHYLESWNDAQPTRYHYSLSQPTIPKIFDTRQAQESLLKWAGKEVSFLDYMKENWEREVFPNQDLLTGFRQFWNQSLHDGVFEMPKADAAQPVFNELDLSAARTEQQNGWEIVLYEKISIGTGRHANNPWLQEMPDPLSSATWDNYVCLTPSDAEELGLENEDVVLVDGKVELPVYIQPGQAKGTIGIAIGYGRTSAGKVANGVGKNVYHLQDHTSGYRRLAGKKVSFEKVEGKSYPLALTQTHNTMEGRAIVRETTLTEWKEDPKAGNEMHMDIIELGKTLYEIPEYEAFHWGLAINLNACTGCGACVISCQAENNVAVIGKEEIKNRRIMHWLRIDRYYSETADNPEVTHMPVMCQHCDNAPCENVCPVAATPHSDEGLNQMSYNRCIGTRYCMNNCPYKVRRFNWFNYRDNEENFPYNFSNEQEKMVLNPDVTVRSRGVVEKCSFCVQRIQEVKLKAKLENRAIKDGELQSACQQACPGDAIVFGDMNDPEAEIYKLKDNPRTYQLLEQLHTLPSVNYLTRVRNKKPEDKARNYKKFYPVYGDFEGEVKGGHGHKGDH